MKQSIHLMILAALLVAAGCASPEKHAQNQLTELRAKFPPGISVAEVRARWDYALPEKSAFRPIGGWAKCQDVEIGRRCAAVETATHKTVLRCERYSAQDGFFSICLCWFFYEQDERLVDVDWEKTAAND